MRGRVCAELSEYSTHWGHRRVNVIKMDHICALHTRCITRTDQQSHRAVRSMWLARITLVKRLKFEKKGADATYHRKQDCNTADEINHEPDRRPRGPHSTPLGRLLNQNPCNARHELGLITQACCVCECTRKHCSEYTCKHIVIGITRDAAEGFIQKVQKMQQISMWRRWWHGRDRG